MTLARRQGPPDNHVLDVVSLMYVACIPFDILPVAFGRTLTGPCALLLIITWLVTHHRYPQKITFPRSAGTLLFLYCAWILCTIFWSVSNGAAVTAALTVLVQAVLVVILSSTLRHQWLRALVTLGWSTSALALVVLSRPASALREGRANVGDIDENITAMVLVAGFAALIYLTTRPGGHSRFLYGALSVVAGAATLHTGSRTGALATVAVLTVALLPLLWRGRRHPVAWVGAATIALVAYLSYLVLLDAGMLPARVVSLLTQSSDYQDSGRMEIIRLYLHTFDRWMLFGVGVGNDADYLQVAEGIYRNSHNYLFKAWVETGLVGLMLLVAFLGVAVRRGFRSVAPRALLLLATPLALFAMTLGTQSTNLFWFVIAFALTPGPTEHGPAPGEPEPARRTRSQTRVDFLDKARPGREPLDRWDVWSQWDRW